MFLKDFDIQAAAEQYQNAKPFKHIALHNIINEDILNRVHDEFPNIRETKSVVYANPLEIKNITSGREAFGEWTNKLTDYLNSPEFLAILQTITGMERPLIADHKLMGGGLHESYSGGLLKLHADFNKHYETGYDRRVNLLVYLNKDWQSEWGGNIELWNRECDELGAAIPPLFNTMVIFNTDDYSYHGFPDAIKCPEGERRKSLALYYYTQGRPAEELNPVPHNSLWGTRKHKDGTPYEADKDVERLANAG